MAPLVGTPSDQLPDVLATGSTDVRFAFISMSAREPDGRDAEYLEWHSLDHRPEQHRLAGLRQSLRIVSTPACRAARAASVTEYDAVDHVMTYLFNDVEALLGFNDLGAALAAGGRMPLRLPTVAFMTADLAGTMATPSAVAGADVIPWRPALGVYLMIEAGKRRSTPSRGSRASPASGGTGARWPRSRIRPMPAACRSPTATWTTTRSRRRSGSARRCDGAGRPATSKGSSPPRSTRSYRSSGPATFRRCRDEHGDVPAVGRITDRDEVGHAVGRRGRDRGARPHRRDRRPPRLPPPHLQRAHRAAGCRARAPRRRGTGTRSPPSGSSRPRTERIRFTTSCAGAAATTIRSRSRSATGPSTRSATAA